MIAGKGFHFADGEELSPSSNYLLSIRDIHAKGGNCVFSSGLIMKPKIVILCAMWKNRRVEAVTFAHLARLKRRVARKCTLLPIAIGSEGDASRHSAKSHKIKYVEANHVPLGGKWNVGWNEALKIECDAIVLVGADAIITKSAIETYVRWLKSSFEFCMPTGVSMFNPRIKKSVQIQHLNGARRYHTVGSGRAFRYEFAQRIGENPFQHSLHANLERTLSQTMALEVEFGRGVSMPVDKFGHIIEIKTKEDVTLMSTSQKDGVTFRVDDPSYTMSLIDDRRTAELIQSIWP